MSALIASDATMGLNIIDASKPRATGCRKKESFSRYTLGVAAISAELSDVVKLEAELAGPDEDAPLPAFTITVPFIHG